MEDSTEPLESHSPGLPAHLRSPADFVSSTAGSVEVIWSSPHLELLLSLHALRGRNGERQTGVGWTEGIKEGCVGEWRGLFEPLMEQCWKHIHQVFHSEVPACGCERDHHSSWQYLVFRGIDLNWALFHCVFLLVAASPAKRNIHVLMKAVFRPALDKSSLVNTASLSPFMSLLLLFAKETALNS